VRIKPPRYYSGEERAAPSLIKCGSLRRVRAEEEARSEIAFAQSRVLAAAAGTRGELIG